MGSEYDGFETIQRLVSAITARCLPKATDRYC
jgi:hypothetical protein